MKPDKEKNPFVGPLLTVFVVIVIAGLCVAGYIFYYAPKPIAEVTTGSDWNTDFDGPEPAAYTGDPTTYNAGLNVTPAQFETKTIWPQTYINKNLGYEITYDENTTIVPLDVIGDGTTCLLVKKGLGFALINVGASIPCGPTGVGIDSKPVKEKIEVASTTYTAGGYLATDSNESFFTFKPRKNTQIIFGVERASDASINDVVEDSVYSQALADIKAVVGTVKFITTSNSLTSSASSTELSEDEILSLAYPLGTNFGGVKGPIVGVIFPKVQPNPGWMTGNVYLTEKGAFAKDINTPGNEGFAVRTYHYMDDTNTQAKVYIDASFGASGQDDRAFLVTKTKEGISVAETTCKRNKNNGCIIDVQ